MKFGYLGGWEHILWQDNRIATRCNNIVRKYLNDVVSCLTKSKLHLISFQTQ